MTLLKNDDSIPKKSHTVFIASWPIERHSGGMGISVKDGWYFGIGFGLAMTIALPAILMVIGSVVGIILIILGAL